MCADRIFMFDLPTNKLLGGIIKRYLKGKFGDDKRVDMTEGCDERLDMEFIRFVLTFNKKVRPLMYEILEDIKFDQHNLVIFKSRVEADNYLRGHL
ncbi:MAG: hypothetical protein SGI89_10115 [bacterium]|nr:hypothetical protein [bacterium]